MRVIKIIVNGNNISACKTSFYMKSFFEFVGIDVHCNFSELIEITNPKNLKNELKSLLIPEVEQKDYFDRYDSVISILEGACEGELQLLHNFLNQFLFEKKLTMSQVEELKALADIFDKYCVYQLIAIEEHTANFPWIENNLNIIIKKIEVVMKEIGELFTNTELFDHPHTRYAQLNLIYLNNSIVYNISKVNSCKLDGSNCYSMAGLDAALQYMTKLIGVDPIGEKCQLLQAKQNLNLMHKGNQAYALLTRLNLEPISKYNTDICLAKGHYWDGFGEDEAMGLAHYLNGAFIFPDNYKSYYNALSECVKLRKKQEAYILYKKLYATLSSKKTILSPTEVLCEVVGSIKLSTLFSDNKAHVLYKESLSRAENSIGEFDRNEFFKMIGFEPDVSEKIKKTATRKLKKYLDYIYDELYTFYRATNDQEGQKIYINKIRQRSRL